MRPCERCLENYWSFETIENIIRATCNMCSHEVEFSKRGSGKIDAVETPRHSHTWTHKDGKQYRDGIEFVLAQDKKGYPKLIPKDQLSNKWKLYI